MSAVRFADDSVATEDELNAIARAFGFMSHREMERVCRDGDGRRMDAENALKAVAEVSA